MSGVPHTLGEVTDRSGDAEDNSLFSKVKARVRALKKLYLDAFKFKLPD